jgi:hypothetical protein
MKLLKLKLLVFAVILFAAGSAFATYSYEVTVNTSSVVGASGDLYFNYANSGAAASTATVSGFTTDGLLAPLNDTNPTDGLMNGSAVSGVLPGTVTFANTNTNNDYLHAMTFGSTFSFLVSFSGAALTAAPSTSNLSTFSLSLITDPGTWNPLLSGGVGLNGESLDINLYNGGAISPSIADPTDVNVSPTPIPPSALLFGTGLIGLVGIHRRAKKLA